MKTRIVSLILILIIGADLKAQSTINGFVTDSLNNPIPDASVYLSKTTFGTLTDSKGAYTLSIPQNGVYEMITSFVGFKANSQIINANGKIQTINIRLSINMILLNEVTVSSKDKNRLKNYSQFVKLFIGETDNSHNCKILNPEDLHFYRDSQDDLLKGFSIKPIRIENKALGYLIIYDLTDFTFNFKSGFLRFAGNHYFQPLSGNKREIRLWTHDRLTAYYGSRMHLLRALYSDSLLQENFKISECKLDPVTKDCLAFIPVPGSRIRVSRSGSKIALYDSNPVFIRYTDNHPELATGLLGFQSQERESTLTFSDTLNVYQNGYFDNPYSVVWGGEMANERIADMLPFDFLPYEKLTVKPDSDLTASPIEYYLHLQQISRSPDQVFVQLDRNMYKAGDTIYFQAYIRDRFTNDFESKSISLYALLFDEKQSVADSSRFKINNSTSSGWLTIPADRHSGRYHFVAFTSMMQNYDPSDAFQLDLSVSGRDNDPDKSGSLINKSNNQPLNSPESDGQLYDLRFLPEGGTLIAGLEQRIGFNATNSKGEPVYIEGLLKTGAGNTVDTIKSGNYGPGFFFCTPQPGMYVELIRGSSKEKFWPIPDPANQGISLSIKQVDNRSFAVEIQSDSYSGEKVTVSGVMNMNQILSRELKLDKKQRIVVQTDQLPSGIAQITLFNSEMRPVAERLIYVNSDKRLKLSIIPGSDLYKPGQETELTISVTDSQGNPAEGICSISVADSISGHDPEIFTPGIEYSFNYQPYFLFNLPPKVLIKGLENLSSGDRDLMLMVYGWSKYNWDFTAEVIPDKEMSDFDILKMKILETSKKHSNIRRMDLISLEGPSIMHLLLNNYGEISLPLDSLPEVTRSVTMMPYTKDRKRVTEAMLSIPFSENYFKSKILLTPLPVVPKDEFIIPPVNYKILPVDGVIEIPEVIIKAHPENKPVYQNIYEERYKYANIVSSDPDLIRTSWDIENAIRRLIPGVDITDNAVISPHGGTSFFGHNIGFLFVLDGMPLYSNGWRTAKSISISDMASITVLEGNQARAIYGLDASGGVVFLNTMFHDPSLNKPHNKWKSQNKNDNMRLPVSIYRSNIEFYNPAKFEAENNPVFKRRSTIFWKSDIYFNGKDPVKIKYTNLKHQGPVIITVNGASVNNMVGNGKAGYVVNNNTIDFDDF